MYKEDTKCFNNYFGAECMEVRDLCIRNHNERFQLTEKCLLQIVMEVTKLRVKHGCEIYIFFAIKYRKAKGVP